MGRAAFGVRHSRPVGYSPAPIVNAMPCQEVTPWPARIAKKTPHIRGLDGGARKAFLMWDPVGPNGANPGADIGQAVPVGMHQFGTDASGASGMRAQAELNK